MGDGYLVGRERFATISWSEKSVDSWRQDGGGIEQVLSSHRLPCWVVV